MAESDDEVPVLDIEENEDENPRRRNGASEIPNFRGKVPDADENGDGKATPQVTWDGDDVGEEDDDDDDESEEDEEGDDMEEGEVGEEFAKERREAARLRREKRLEEEQEESDDEEVVEEEDLWDFPPDEEKWTEEDIGEEWADAWQGDDKVGFDPELVEDEEEVIKQWKEGGGPPARPYYVPYRKHYPLIPEDHPDIQTPQDVVEELERYEEFLVWASYIFEDGSSYEGTVWDDLAHGKGVYTTALELCKYEGEWFQNAMEGHGVLEVDVPVIEPPPNSEAAKKLRAQGKFLETDLLDPEEKEWVKMEVEDAMEMEEDPTDSSALEDDDIWVKQFGEKPEKGHYRYAGQWKHNRMHGCGLYEVNGRGIWGKFYFGEMLPVPGECDEDQVAIHSGLAEIAAAKARMFVNKPDGMVREAKGPYSDPSHPYMYEEEDLWMAPGFINAFYEVPELWKRYVEEVDEEQEMWLNSFIKSPFRIPMPPELEYQWEKDDEFVVLSNIDSNPLYQDPANVDPDVEGDILLHTPSGQLINWAEDPEGNLRFFIQPIPEDGVIRPEEAIPLPLGFDEFMGEVDEHGNRVDESRRGLSLEERRKLEVEDKKKEKERKFREQIEEIERIEGEKLKELELDLYVKELEHEVENIILEERFQAELEAAAEDDEEVVEGGEESERKEGEASVVGDQPEAEVPTDEDQKPEDGDDKDDDEGDNDEGGNDDSDGEDDEDEKPQSFGKVAVVVPEERKSSPQGPFPTVFASLSLGTQVAFKHVWELSRNTVQKRTTLDSEESIQVDERTPSLIISRKAMPEIVNALNLSGSEKPVTCVKLPKSPGAIPKHKKIPAVQSLLAAFQAKRSSSSSQQRRCGKPSPITNKVVSRLSHTNSSRTRQGSRGLWIVPDIDVLSMAIPV